MNYDFTDLIKMLEELGTKFDNFTNEVSKLASKIDNISKISKNKMDDLSNTIKNLSTSLKDEDNEFFESIERIINILVDNLNKFKEEMNIPIIKEAANEIVNLNRQAKNIDLNKQISRGLREINNLIVSIKEKMEKKDNE
ncbi:MAG: hypothetical protein ACTSWR_09865 [Candidatus Helarchaeota archaeon]